LRILYFAPIDWDFIYQRPQHLAERLSLKHEFIYVQPFGLRNLRVSDIQRVASRLKYFFNKLEIKKNLSIKNFFFIPIITPTITKLNSLLLRHKIKFLINSKTIIWVTYPSPLICGILKRIKHVALIYEMIDDYPETHRDMEKWLANNASLIIATSGALIEKAKVLKRDARIRIIGNGVDFDFFKSSVKHRPPEFKDQEKIIGYVGSIDRWMDFELIDYLADRRPDLNFVFVGPIMVKMVPLKKNIRFIGSIDYKIVPDYCNRFDVCLIPFQPGEFADTINPVKLYEYLALGKPVVTSHMKELERYKDIIYLSVTKEDFLKNVETALNENDSEIKEIRKDIARANDWNMISEIVHEELLKLSAS
jgi:glycosyltransferase involved in cell wall biosynthesis